VETIIIENTSKEVSQEREQPSE